MKTATAAIAMLLLFSVAESRAGERPLLRQLEQEVRTLTEQTGAAVVTLSPPGTARGDRRSNPLLYFGEKRTALALLAGQAALARRAATGVLVGDPPVIVTAAGATGGAAEIEFQLADGTKGTAKLRVRETDLGVAVFDLPADVASGRKGLEVDSGSVERGRLGVVPGREAGEALPSLGLVVTRGTDPHAGWLLVDGLAAGVEPGLPLVGVDGRLLGIASARALAGPADVRQQAISALSLRSLVDLTGSPRIVSLSDRFLTDAGRLGLSVPAGAFVPGKTIARVLGDLRAHGRIRHSYLGVVLGQRRGSGEYLGVEIQSILGGSPAAEAGLEKGARIRSLDGRAVTDPAVLNRSLLLRRPGDTIRLGLVGEESEISVVLGDRGEAEWGLVSPETLGLSCVSLGGELRRFLGLDEGLRGVVARNVAAGSAAAQAGLERGDVIVEAGGEPVADLEELRAAVAGAAKEVVLMARRGKETLTAVIRVPAERGRKRAR